MALPNFLIIEMRLAFRTCAQQHKGPNLRCFSTTRISKKDTPRRYSSNNQHNRALTPKKPSPPSENNAGHGRRPQDQTGLAPRDPEKRAVGANRRVPVPLKVIPKAQLSPQVHLTPRQRLHVEMMTRRPTVDTPDKKKRVYRERIQIYDIGSFKQALLITFKMSTIVTICADTFVIAPANLNAGAALWTTALIWLAGFVPAIGMYYSTHSFVSRIFLDLPPHARESPKTVMEYAKNLPSETMLDIRYLKPWGIEGSISGSTSDFVPTKGWWARPMTFKWKDESALKLRRRSTWDPESFFVEAKTASGAKSKSTTPGVWDTVYNQVVKDNSKPSEKWKSSLEP